MATLIRRTNNAKSSLRVFFLNPNGVDGAEGREKRKNDRRYGTFRGPSSRYKSTPHCRYGTSLTVLSLYLLTSWRQSMLPTAARNLGKYFFAWPREWELLTLYMYSWLTGTKCNALLIYKYNVYQIPLKKSMSYGSHGSLLYVSHCWTVLHKLLGLPLPPPPTPAAVMSGFLLLGSVQCVRTLLNIKH
jgi:hypothetical protein